jgi:cytoskeletal protein RodZ
MTARQQVRTGSAATAPETWTIETQRAPQVGEILQTARERKGIDLVRAERETKIRARHLVALERGDLDDLPAPVYAKGFLRNYSLYLGLDPDEMISRWRREADQPRKVEAVKVAPPPQPITAPRQGFKLTSGLLVAVILSVIVAGFVGYVGLQLLRFSQNPEITLDGPSVRRLNPDASSVVLAGTSAANARVTATGASDLERTTTADESGDWTIELPVGKGRNDFTVTSTDLETGRDSIGLEVIAEVPVGSIADPDARPTPALPGGSSTGSIGGEPSAQVRIGTPKTNATARNGVVKLRGTSDAPSVLVSFQWLGKKDAAPPAPDPVELAVVDGTFKGTFTLPKGPWQVAAAGQIDGGTPAVSTSKVKSVYENIVATVTAVDGATRVAVEADGQRISDDGLRLKAGQSQTFLANDQMTIQVGNAKSAQVTVDGVDRGTMGKVAEPKVWLLEPGQAPQTVR